MNNFVALKNFQSTQKFLLVRLEPARYVNTQLVFDSGTTYTMTFPYDVFKVEQNSVGMTKVSSSPSDGEYSYDESTKLLTINTSSGVASSNAIIVHYYIYFTGERTRVVGQDPETPTIDLREYESRILRAPTITQTVKNIIQGTLSISSSTLTLINNESFFQQYLTDDDSFNLKPIKVWQCLEDIENIQKIFEGTINSVKVDRDKVQLGVRDNLGRLDNPATMGDEDIYFTDDSFTSVDPNSIGLPVRYFFGSVSRYKLDSLSIATLNTARKLDIDSLSVAVCTNYSNIISTTTNREYGIGRVGSNGVTDFSFTPSNVDNTNPNYTRLDGTSTEIAKIHIGDTFIVTGSGTYYCRVVDVDRIGNSVFIEKQGSIVNGDAVQTNAVPSIVINDGIGTYYPLYGRDYSATVTPLASGNNYISINFVNNFEATLGMLTLSPINTLVGFKIKPHSDYQLHGTVLEEMINKAGLSTNSASFTTSNTTLNVNANFSIPQFDEEDYNKYYDYVENVLSSSLGYIFLNNDFEIGYSLFSTPSSSTEITDTDINEDSFRFDIDYNDIVTQLITFNPHYSSSEFTDVASVTVESNRAKHLHGAIKVSRFRHYLEDYTSKAIDLINIRSERFIKYVFTTKSINYDSIIGDEFLLNKDGIAGQVATKPIKLLTLNKRTNETFIEATDLLNL